MAMPLEPYTVIDLTRARSGPTCVRQLADLGARVIHVEAKDDPQGDFARDGFDYQNLHRNKRSMTLDLKHPRGVEVLKRLVVRADVVVENFRPDVKRRLGIDYEALSAINPRLIYGSISGFGQTGPYRDRPGYDQIAQGLGGLMSITGLPGQGPVRVGIPVADLTSGIFLAQGILAALIERERSGKGQWVHTSLLEAMVTDARLPGHALARRQGDPAAGRQRPPDRHPDRRVPHRGRAHQHRGVGPGDVPAPVRGGRRPSSSTTRASRRRPTGRRIAASSRRSWRSRSASRRAPTGSTRSTPPGCRAVPS